LERWIALDTLDARMMLAVQKYQRRRSLFGFALGAKIITHLFIKELEII
jgi:hypothetical protein